ncbi:probable outer membrane protein pmp20 [Dysidea avara]|uniref:probable outer membrane protein pmp20 n=1 Tax=Dysidea avara TaxID=196820 RepID=UPI0033193EBE
MCSLAIVSSLRTITMKVTVLCYTIQREMKIITSSSLVYLGSSINETNDYLSIQNSVLSHNQAVPVYISHNTLHLKGDVLFEHNVAIDGGAIFSNSSQVIFEDNCNISFRNNSATTNGGAILLYQSKMYCEKRAFINFTNNSAKSLGGALYSFNRSVIQFGKHSVLAFEANCGGAICSLNSSLLLFDGRSTVTFTDNTAKYGGAVYAVSHSVVLIDGNTTVNFSNNSASEFGGAVNCNQHCNVLFTGISTVMFISNKANIGGGAVLLQGYSDVMFQGNTHVTFNDNNAIDGGAINYYYDNSEIKFHGNANVIFMGNSANNGGAMLSGRNSSTPFGGNTTVTFVSNYAREYGGAFCLYTYSNLSFTEYSVIRFIDNKAKQGSAMYSQTYSNVFFDGNSNVTFFNNSAQNGGAMLSIHYSAISFDGNSKVIFTANRALHLGGAILVSINCDISFYGSSTVTFSNNSATKGGAVRSEKHSNVFFDGNTKIILKNNHANENGGAISTYDSSRIKFDNNTIVTYESNKADERGGAVASNDNCSLIFHGNSNVTFDDNNAVHGGAILSYDNSDASFTGNTTVTFNTNKVQKTGGSIICENNCNIRFNSNSMTTFDSNKASNGGAMFITKNSYLLFADGTNVQFKNNKAIKGGAINNQQSNITFAMKSFTSFTYNSATRNGGAIYLNNNFTITFENKSDVIFYQNNATRFGGAIHGELKQTNRSKILSITNGVDFSNNTGLVGDDVYLHIQASCDETCLNSSIEGLKVTHNYPPRHLALYNPSTCINDNNASSTFQSYFISNIMLGQNIKINACVLSFYNQPASGVNFGITGESPHHKLDSTRFVPIACNLFEGISVVGKKITDKTNFSMTITSYTNREVEIAVGLIAELSPCHPGFHYDNTTQKCVCYGDSKTVSCSGSTSTIKRGYWFGIVDGKTTVAVCPNNYCNFTCCETTNGFYQLSPVRFNQCISHRSGTACGSCEEGYTLSFDSAKCVSVDKCTPGQAALVIILSIIYWIVLVVVVFVVTYYHVEIGYFYVITYYYSMLDILLDQNLYVSQELFTVVSIMSSAAKMTPQFLGQICFVKNMSGIDQQVIHYVHPLAVTIIIGILCLSAKKSYRFSAFVSRGIIRMVCYLLLLSYTSVATTSLLLLRSLTFHNLDKVYTFLSPDIEYFHGRHLPYGIIAILCTLVIVIGLSLLLLLEPFLNDKINFYRIKPLLDQFQGCYKDKYRSFAAYYMICRLVIIIIIINNSTNNNTTQDS